MIRFLRRSAIVSTLTVLVLTGCGEGDVRTGAAAVVGDDRITTTQLQETVDRGLADPQAAQQLGANRPGYQLQTLNRLVRSRVLASAAADEQIKVEQGLVDARIEQFAQQAGGRAQLDQQAAQNGIPPADLPGFVRELLVEEALGEKLTAGVAVPPATLAAAYKQNLAEFDQVRSAHILVKDPARAQSILKQVQADPSRFAALAKQFSIDTSNKDQGGDLGASGRGKFVPPFEKALFAAKPNSYFVVKTEFGSHVVHVVERRTVTLEQATPQLRQAALQQQAQTRVATRLSEEAAELGVTVNPRFGRWDPATTSVLDAPDGNNGVTTPAPGTSGGPGSGAPRGGETAPDSGQGGQGAPDGGQGAPDGGAPAPPQGGSPEGTGGAPAQTPAR